MARKLNQGIFGFFNFFPRSTLLKPTLLFMLTLFTACSKINSPNTDLHKNTKYFFTIYGDSREGNDVFSVLLNMSWQFGQSNYLVHLGDMISSASSTYQWPSFKAVLEEHMPETKIFPIVGNHDVDSAKSMRIFNAVFPKVGPAGYYSQKIEDCFCIFLNSEDIEDGLGTIGSVQLAWLKEQLQSTEALHSRFRIVYVHRPLFPQNHHKGLPLQPTNFLHKLFLENNVNAVISGHEHSYTRQERDGIAYVISGGAGSPLYEPGGKGSAFYHFLLVSFIEPLNSAAYLNFRAIDFYGNTRDEFEIRF